MQGEPQPLRHLGRPIRCLGCVDVAVEMVDQLLKSLRELLVIERRAVPEDESHPCHDKLFVKAFVNLGFVQCASPSHGHALVVMLRLSPSATLLP